MEFANISVTTPALLFSAISLIMLAYTNRFLAYASLVRSLAEQYRQHPDAEYIYQIKNLRKRLTLTQGMQVLGILSLLLCVLSMFLLYIQCNAPALIIFGIALILLIVSLVLLVWEIQISVKALDYHLKEIEQQK